MPRTVNLAVIPGDGIGPEVIAEALKVLEATGVDVERTEYPFSAGHLLATGSILSDEDLAALAKHDAILLGAIGGDPRDARLAG
ncbi:MAG: 3-isopropylmalate dehydrogenase, partial [Salinibacterium sp.]